MDSLRDFEPVKGFEDGSDVLKSWRSGDSEGGSVLDELQLIYVLGGSIQVE